MFYQFQTGRGGRMMRQYTIILQVEPSRMSAAIDRYLIERSGRCDLDGPNRLLTYFFTFEKDWKTAKEYLIRCGWKETKVKDVHPSILANGEPA